MKEVELEKVLHPLCASNPPGALDAQGGANLARQDGQVRHGEVHVVFHEQEQLFGQLVLHNAGHGRGGAAVGVSGLDAVEHAKKLGKLDPEAQTGFPERKLACANSRSGCSQCCGLLRVKIHGQRALPVKGAYLGGGTWALCRAKKNRLGTA